MIDYLEGVTAENFDWREYLASKDRRLIARGAGRRALCRYDPMLFAILYMRHHMRSELTGGEITFSDFHIDLCRFAIRLAKKDVREAEIREAFVAYRGAGKSTWLFLILPAWTMAHRHRKFIAAFAETGLMAEQHLLSLKREFDNNALLRKDHPRLCRPQKRPAGTTVSDTKSLYIADNDCAFQAKGMDSTTLGTKIGDQRPDWLLFDDVEPDESNYSAYQKSKRLKSIVNAVFPMNTRAAVTISGTVNMPGAIMHDLVRHAIEPNADDLEAWVTEERIKMRYYPLLAENGAGESVSSWPARYPTVWCHEQEGTSAFQLSMMNNPMGREGGYWVRDDFRYESGEDGEIPSRYTRWILEVDPAVTTKVTSDYTGLAVVAFDPRAKECIVVDSWHVKVAGEKLRRRTLGILQQYPRIALVRVETQNGGEYVASAFHDLPVKFEHHPATISKDVRLSWTLEHYQRRHVTHSRRQRVLEEEMISYPKGGYDDVADAACTAILYFLEKPKRIDVTITTGPGYR